MKPELMARHKESASRNKRAIGGIILTCITVAGILLAQKPAIAQETLWKTYFTEAFKALQSNDSETAEKMFLSAQEQAQGFGESDQRYYKTIEGLALAYAARKKFADAEKTYEKAISIKEKALGPDSPELSLTMGNFADLLLAEGKYKQAEILYQNSLKGLMAMSPAVYAEKSQNLGLCLSEEGLYSQAETALQNAKQKEIELYGANSNQAISTQINLTIMHYKQGAYKQAEAEANQALQDIAKSATPDAHITDSCLTILEQISVRLGHYTEAEAAAKELVKHTEARADATSADYPRALERLANVYFEEHKYAEAEPLLLKAKSILEKQLPGHPYLADCLVDLAELYNDQGKYSDAQPLLQQALSIRQSALGSEHSDVAECLTDIAYIDAQQNKSTEAENAYKRALDIKSKTVGKEHPDYAKALDKLGLLYATMHKNAEAETALSEALMLREKILPPEHRDIALTMSQLAGFYKDNNMPEKAEALYKRLSERDAKYEPTNAAAKVSDLNNLSAVSAMLGKSNDATQLQGQASQLRKNVPGGDSDPNALALLQASSNSAPPITDKWCLCIGISNFKDSSINLRYAAKDATDFRNFLVAKGNFKEDHVKLLTDADATRENILGQLGDKWLGKAAKPTDLVIIYISSHGSTAMEKAGGANFLVAYDTNKTSLLASGIPMQWLSEMVKEQMKSNRILLILDVCHSGSVTESEKRLSQATESGSAAGGGKGLTRDSDITVSTLKAGDGQIILCSSAADQVSWESKEYPNSVFTKKLIEALQIQGADTGLVNAYKVMKDKVQEEVLRDRSVAQTPMIKENWHGGEVSPLVQLKP
jgi:Tfp pilus assembly protein PilF